MLSILMNAYYASFVESFKNDKLDQFVKIAPKPVIDSLKQHGAEEMKSGKCEACEINNNCPLQDLVNGKFDNIAATDTAT